jgi:hypothetical protein
VSAVLSLHFPQTDRTRPDTNLIFNRFVFPISVTGELPRISRSFKLLIRWLPTGRSGLKRRSTWQNVTRSVPNANEAPGPRFNVMMVDMGCFYVAMPGLNCPTTATGTNNIKMHLSSTSTWLSIRKVRRGPNIKDEYLCHKMTAENQSVTLWNKDASSITSTATSFCAPPRMLQKPRSSKVV